MILVRLLIAATILIAGILMGKFLKYLVKKAERENKEMEAILKKYGRDKHTTDDGGK